MDQGKTIGHYNIIKLLGKGGMGEVYLAEDTKLKREVAIKVLPEAVQSDPERLKRFRREAEAAAKLKHNNIATIHALEDIDGQTFIVMEYVEGQTLADLIPQGGVDLDTFFSLFIPLVDALSHAHEHGRVHRDLKPGNIMITPDGTPQILDFGLAHIEPERAELSDLDSDAPTVTMQQEAADSLLPSLTQGRGFLGTPAYMSPEQIEGKKVDARTDIFSIGIVMYETITGQRPFKGDSLESIIGRILTEEPASISDLKPVTPHQLWWTIKKTLQKDRDRRTQTDMELHTELQEAQKAVQAGMILVDTRAVTSLGPLVQEPVPFWRRPLPIAVILIVFGIIMAAAVWFIKPESVAAVHKFRIAVGKKSFSRENFTGPVISPDGTKLVYVADGQLWLRHLDQLESRLLSGTEGAQQPFWSPQSDFIGYVSQGTIRKVPVQGGPSTMLRTLSGTLRGATWLADDTVIGSLNSYFYSFSAEDETLTVFLQPDTAMNEENLFQPHSLPDGKSLLHLIFNEDISRDLVVQSNDQRITLLNVPPGDAIYDAIYAPSGHVLYAHRQLGNSDFNIWALPVSPSDFSRIGEPFVVAQQGRFPSVSDDGTLVYLSSTVIDPQLMWVDRRGVVEKIGQPQTGMSLPALSPDGKQVAAVSTETGNRDIWIHDIGRGTRTRLTFDPANQSGGHGWSPDGKQVVFTSRSEIYNLFMRQANGRGEVQSITAGPHRVFNPYWSGVQNVILYHVFNATSGNRDIWYLPMSDDRQPMPFLATPYNEALPKLSPDGQYVAYQSDESGQFEIYVLSFPDGEDKSQVSISGGILPRWNPQDSELFYIEDNQLMAVEVDTRSEFSAELPRPLFTQEQVGTLFSASQYTMTYDVSPDGQRFVMMQYEGEGEGGIIVVQNWVKEFDTR